MAFGWPLLRSLNGAKLPRSPRYALPTGGGRPALPSHSLFKYRFHQDEREAPTPAPAALAGFWDQPNLNCERSNWRGVPNAQRPRWWSSIR
jgi:hypothetical protein